MTNGLCCIHKIVCCIHKIEKCLSWIGGIKLLQISGFGCILMIEFSSINSYTGFTVGTVQ